MSKTILVTGGLGHIGSQLIRNFGPDITEVRILDNLLTQRYVSLFDLPESPRYHFIEADIMTADLATHLEGVDIVIHLAAITNAEATIGNEEETERINFEGLVRVAEACEKSGVRLLFPSTTSVYGSQESVVDETCVELKPQSPYAVAKLKAEEYLAQRKESGLRFVTCRFGTIFGWSPGIRFHTAVNKFIWQAVTGQPITVWKTAWEQKRPYLELGDCVRAVNFLIEHDFFDGETYNVVTQNYTVKDVVETIREFVPSVEVAYVDSKIMNQLSYDVSADKFAKQGFTPSGDLTKEIGVAIQKLKGIQKV